MSNEITPKAENKQAVLVSAEKAVKFLTTKLLPVILAFSVSGSAVLASNNAGEGGGKERFSPKGPVEITFMDGGRLLCSTEEASAGNLYMPPPNTVFSAMAVNCDLALETGTISTITVDGQTIRVSSGTVNPANYIR